MEGHEQLPSGRVDHADAEPGDRSTAGDAPQMAAEADRQIAHGPHDGAGDEHGAGVAAVGETGQGQLRHEPCAEGRSDDEAQAPGGQVPRLLDLGEESEDGPVACREHETEQEQNGHQRRLPTTRPGPEVSFRRLGQ